MAKKEETPELSEEELAFKETVIEWRSAKVDLDTASKKETALKADLKTYIEENEDYRDEYYNSMKLTRTFTFLEKDNIKLAKEKGIKVKYSKMYSLNISPARIKELIKEGTLKRDEINIIKTPKLKKLEADFEENDIDGFYKQGLRIGLKK